MPDSDNTTSLKPPTKHQWRDLGIASRIASRVLAVADLSGMNDLPNTVLAEAFGSLEYAESEFLNLSTLCSDALLRLRQRKKKKN